jgi:hypothetical protein
MHHRRNQNYVSPKRTIRQLSFPESLNQRFEVFVVVIRIRGSKIGGDENLCVRREPMKLLKQDDQQKNINTKKKKTKKKKSTKNEKKVKRLYLLVIEHICLLSIAIASLLHKESLRLARHQPLRGNDPAPSQASNQRLHSAAFRRRHDVRNRSIESVLSVRQINKPTRTTTTETTTETTTTETTNKNNNDNNNNNNNNNNNQQQPTISSTKCNAPPCTTVPLSCCTTRASASRVPMSHGVPGENPVKATTTSGISDRIGKQQQQHKISTMTSTTATTQQQQQQQLLLQQ